MDFDRKQSGLDNRCEDSKCIDLNRVVGVFLTINALSVCSRLPYREPFDMLSVSITAGLETWVSEIVSCMKDSRLAME